MSHGLTFRHCDDMLGDASVGEIGPGLVHDFEAYALNLRHEIWSLLEAKTGSVLHKFGKGTWWFLKAMSVH